MSDAQYTSAQAAAHVGTTPKSLRAMLRATPGWNNPGSAGRYVFAESDLPALERAFRDWSSSHRAPVAKPVPVVPATTVPKTPRPRVTDEPAELEWPHPIPAQLVGAARLDAEARIDRLEMLLKSRGLHVSQSRDDRFTRAS